MSTYNGEKYITTQLDSLLSQIGVNLIIYIRDDGSSDKTREILKNYAKVHPNIVLSFENNIGYKKSFLKALHDAPNCDYYGFCDQDDYWFENKILSTIELIERTGSSLGFGNAIVTDENLIGEKTLYSKIDIPSFPESLYSSNTHGFLFCFTKEIRNLAIRYPIEEFDIPHDFWLITIAGLFGTIACDKEMVVAKYRRLPTSISRRKPLQLFFNRALSLFYDKGIVEKYAKNILIYYDGELENGNMDLVNSCAFYRGRWNSKWYLLKNRTIKSKYKLKILLNKL